MAEEAIKVMAQTQPGLRRNVVGETPSGSPDVDVQVVPAWQLVLVRAGRTALQTLLMTIGVGTTAGYIPGISDALPPTELQERLLLALYATVLAFVITAAQNAYELSAKWDSAHPELRA